MQRLWREGWGVHQLQHPNQRRVHGPRFEWGSGWDKQILFFAQLPQFRNSARESQIKKRLVGHGTAPSPKKSNGYLWLCAELCRNCGPGSGREGTSAVLSVERGGGGDGGSEIQGFVHQKWPKNLCPLQTFSPEEFFFSGVLRQSSVRPLPGGAIMAKPRSITVVSAGLSGAFDETVPQIPISGTCHRQGMPLRPRISTRRKKLRLSTQLSSHVISHLPQKLLFYPLAEVAFSLTTWATLAASPVRSSAPAPLDRVLPSPRTTSKSGPALSATFCPEEFCLMNPWGSSSSTRLTSTIQKSWRCGREEGRRGRTRNQDALHLDRRCALQRQCSGRSTAPPTPAAQADGNAATQSICRQQSTVASQRIGPRGGLQGRWLNRGGGGRAAGGKTHFEQ